MVLKTADSYRRRELIEAVRSSRRTSGLTHDFYRYPARFGSDFAQGAIRYFTKPGDVVLDPFMGGGTTAVEALAAGRKFVGSDINPLAYFISQVKSQPLSERDEKVLSRWAQNLSSRIDMDGLEPQDSYQDVYKRHVPWRMRKLLAQALATLPRLATVEQERFARCSLLNAAQWALDCKERTPTKAEFLDRHLTGFGEMLDGMRRYREALSATGLAPRHISKRRALFEASAASLHELKSARRLGVPKLLLTSPPYMGVHVLYHRWQINGRRETPAPYWIAGKTDGHTGTYYTFADRRNAAADRYMARLKECFFSASQLLNKRSFIAQLVAFSDANIQLPIYLRALSEIGLEACEAFMSETEEKPIERNVPNRRWYAQLSAQSTSSKEFLLVHRLK